MSLSEDLIKKLSGVYEPSATIYQRFKEKDIAFKTNEKGNAVLLFIGKRSEDGLVRGERFARRLAYDKEGKIIKDHWDNKGKAT